MTLTVNEVIDCIGALRGSKQKVEYLQSLCEDPAHKEVTEGLKEVVKYALDDMLSFHITSVPEYATSIFDTPSCPECVSLSTGIEKLMRLNAKGSANLVDKEEVGRLAFAMTEADRELFTYIVERDLRCGMGISSFRKVWGKDFVPEMEYALMAPFDEKKIIKSINFKKGAFAQLKSDGARAISTKRGGIEFRSRNGKPIKGLDFLKSQVAYMTFEVDEDFDLDGELLVANEDDTGYLDRKTGNGIINKAVKGTISPEEASRLRFVVWDLIIRTKEGLQETYKERFERLSTLVHRSTAIHLTLSKVVYSLREAKEFYQQLVNLGEEGIILKNADSLWTPGDSDAARRANGFKFKEEFEADFEIVGWYPGKPKSKYAEMIGGLNYQSACGSVVGDVGSGLSDDERARDPESLIGKVVNIKYNGRITARGRESFSLFLPTVLEIREDKTEADDLDKIIAAEEAKRALEV